MTERASRKWFFVRVSVLLGVLAVVSLYAWMDFRRRKERNAWKRTLDIALIVVRDGPVSDGAISALRSQTGALETSLARELARYRREPRNPFSFTWYGPAELEAPLPTPPEDGVLAAVTYAWKLWRFTADVDARADVPSRGYDSRVYVVVRPPGRSGFVEGMSEHGGRVGVALAELDELTAPLTLFVVAHELFHTLGATDRYDAAGRTLFPDGLAEPDKSPLFPQRYAELMARNRPLDQEHEVPPESLDELFVGSKTAAEIGWPLTP